MIVVFLFVVIEVFVVWLLRFSTEHARWFQAHIVEVFVESSLLQSWPWRLLRYALWPLRRLNGGNKLPGDPFGDSGFDQRFLTAPMKSAVDKYQLLPEFLKSFQALAAFGCFTDEWMYNELFCRFLNVRIGKPSIEVDSSVEDITPPTCRLSDQTYAAPIYVDIEYMKGSRNNPEKERKVSAPLDPGGYFVIKGTEKVILIQEQLSKNRIIIDTDKKGNITASVTSSTEKIKTKTVIVMENEKLWLQLNQFPKKVPLMVVMKAMGMESDQEVIQMVGRDPRYSFLLLPSIEECTKCKVYTQEQALEYLDSKVHQDNFQPKCIYVAVMIRRIVDAILNKDAMDDKDYVGNKQLELSGQLISLPFEDLFKSMTTELKNQIDKKIGKPDKVNNFDILPELTHLGLTITLGLERTLSTGNFEIKRFRMQRKGMTQVLQGYHLLVLWAT
ncbi:DNA-directed RNA polymerase III subunit RPC2 [Spatholobus suberectus]|nr:DNA-directed RNA polymerase III subunit RPC2 [Spatholobus suberectus]